MQSSKSFSAVMVAALFAISATAAHAGDACRNIRFSLVNQKDHPITVMAVKYFNRANNRLQTEAIRNIRCPARGTCITNGDNLRDAEGEDLTRFFFVLKNEGGENRHDTGAKIPRNPQCNADSVYGPFVISAND